MPVAKSFQTFEQINAPYESAGRMYVDVRNPKTNTVRKVRWYTDYEYGKLYPEEKANIAAAPLRTLKDTLGFEKGYITIFKGETYPLLEWFQNSICRYHKLFGWYVPSAEEIPADVPPSISPVSLSWEDVSIGDNSLKLENEVKAAVEQLIYEPTKSEFIGSIGERLTLDVTIVAARPIDSYFGASTLHTMKDSDENVFVWITSSKSWPVGAQKKIKATVKEHKIFRGTKQTYLTRCAEVV